MLQRFGFKKMGFSKAVSAEASLTTVQRSVPRNSVGSITESWIGYEAYKSRCQAKQGVLLFCLG